MLESTEGKFHQLNYSALHSYKNMAKMQAMIELYKTFMSTPELDQQYEINKENIEAIENYMLESIYALSQQEQYQDQVIFL